MGYWLLVTGGIAKSKETTRTRKHRKILNCTLEREDGVVWTGLVWFRIGTIKHGNKPSGSMKCWEVLE
jgi:hypothetical protein